MHTSHQPARAQGADLAFYRPLGAFSPLLRHVIVAAHGTCREPLICSAGTPAARCGERGASLLPQVCHRPVRRLPRRGRSGR